MVSASGSPPPLTCAAVEASVVAYLKGGLAPAREAAIRNHLLGCNRCTEVILEARALDAALYAAAPRRPTALDPARAEQLQADLYRRLRRAVVLQRTRALTGRVAATVATLLFLAALAFIIAPWLRYVATVEATPTPPAIAAPGPFRRAMPEPPPAPPVQVVPPGTVAIEHHSPADSVRDLLGAAVSGDAGEVRRLLSGTLTRAPRAQARFAACRGTLDLDALTYSTIRYRSNVAGVRVSYHGQLAGELKLLLHTDGYWYLHYIHYDTFNSILGEGCLALPA